VGDYLIHYYDKRNGTIIHREVLKAKLPKIIKRIEKHLKEIASGESLDSLMPNKRYTLCIINEPITMYRVAGIELRGSKTEVVFLPYDEEYKQSNAIRMTTWKK